MTPNYTKTNIPNTSAAAIFTKNRIAKIRTKDKIKFLYVKKAKPNNELYKIHLKLAHEWGKCWYPIEESIIEPLNKRMNINTQNWKKNLIS